jgi:hypothetical protein
MIRRIVGRDPGKLPDFSGNLRIRLVDSTAGSMRLGSRGFDFRVLDFLRHSDIDIRHFLNRGDKTMPDNFLAGKDEPFNLDMVRDELGRVPVIGSETDRELFVDLPSGGLAAPHITPCRRPGERELLSNDFTSA